LLIDLGTASAELSQDKRPLIPRPETEAWTEQLIAHLTERFNDKPFRFLDLCAGSGAIGLAVLAKLPNAHVTFAELVPELAELIRENITINQLDASRARVCTGDLFSNIAPGLFDIIATNPPYIPEARNLDASVTEYEPSLALFSGADGLDLIRRIAGEAHAHLSLQGEVWMECDIENVAVARDLLQAGGAVRAEVHADVYGRPRLVLAYY
jgi:release factor glutamine methyltransferase